MGGGWDSCGQTVSALNGYGCKRRLLETVGRCSESSSLLRLRNHTNNVLVVYIVLFYCDLSRYSDLHCIRTLPIFFTYEF